MRTHSAFSCAQSRPGCRATLARYVSCAGNFEANLDRHAMVPYRNWIIRSQTLANSALTYHYRQPIKLRIASGSRRMTHWYRRLFQFRWCGSILFSRGFACHYHNIDSAVCVVTQRNYVWNGRAVCTARHRVLVRKVVLY